MFETKDEIIPALTAAGMGEWAEIIASLCEPAVAFEAAPAGDPGRIGGLRIGGLPDLPAGMAWPVRAAYPGWQRMVAHSHHGPALTRGLADDRPLWFLAQIDLVEADRALPPGEATQDRLPDHGRLLFFWDVNCGPWNETAAAARVIFDDTPADALAPRAAPDDLAFGYFPKAFAAQPVAMRGVWSMPARELLGELLQDDSVTADDDDDRDAFWSDIIDNGAGVLASGREVLPHRLRGWPVPDQGDPRYAAVLASRGIDLMHDEPRKRDREAVNLELHVWTLLAQFDCRSFGFAEGIVCFVMREDDLTRRDFSRVHPVYQQT